MGNARYPLFALLVSLTAFLIAVTSSAQTRGRRNQELGEWLRNFRVTRDVTYAVAEGTELKLDVYEPKDGEKELRPILVFIHGGGWRAGDKIGGARFAPAVVGAGFVMFSINYRLTDTARFPAQIYDCKSAIRWIRKNAERFGGDPTRIGVFGTSAGGHLSALLGTSNGVDALEGNVGVRGISSDVQAVADFFGPSDFLRIGDQLRTERDGPLAELLGREPSKLRELARIASPVSYVDAGDPPFLIIHGTDDPLVPIEQSRELYGRLKDAGVPAELIEVDGGRHGDFLKIGRQGREIIEKMLDFFDRHLK